MALLDLVNDFLANRIDLREAEAAPFRPTVRTFRDAVKRAAYSVRADGKRHWHQYRIPQKVLATCAANLDNIRGQLKQCVDFDAIHTLVNAHIRYIHGVGPLLVYDIAERIGTALGKEPTLLYVHAGVRSGLCI